MEDVEAPGWSPRDLGTTFDDRRGPVDAAALSSETRAGLWSVSTPGVLRWHIKGEEGGANAQEGRPWSWKRGAGGAHDGRANLSVPPGRSYTPPTRAADAMATARCVAGEGQLRAQISKLGPAERTALVSLWQTVRNYAEFPAQPTRVDRGHGGDSRTRGGAPGVRNVSQHRPFPISAPVTRPLASPASPALGCPIYHSQTKASLTSPHDRRLPPRADLNPLPTAGYPRATGRWMDSSGKRWYEPLARSPRSVAQSHSFIRRTLGSVSPSSRPLARPHALTFPIVHKPTSNHHRSRSHGRDA